LLLLLAFSSWTTIALSHPCPFTHSLLCTAELSTCIYVIFLRVPQAILRLHNKSPTPTLQTSHFGSVVAPSTTDSSRTRRREPGHLRHYMHRGSGSRSRLEEERWCSCTARGRLYQWWGSMYFVISIDIAKVWLAPLCWLYISNL
jgi:hypothetical protein